MWEQVKKLTRMQKQKQKQKADLQELSWWCLLAQLLWEPLVWRKPLEFSVQLQLQQVRALAGRLAEL